MSRLIDARRVENEAYRARWDDGLVDLFGGLSLVWIGAAWCWAESLAGLAGVIPAALTAPFVTLRTSFVTNRAGHVRFSTARRRWERRRLLVLAATGGVLGLAAVGFVALSGGSAPGGPLDWAAPGLIAWLAAVPILVVAAASGLPRLFVYAGLLFVGGAVTAIADGNPGAPLLAAGALAASWGAVLVVGFIRHHPYSTSDDTS